MFLKEIGFEVIVFTDNAAKTNLLDYNIVRGLSLSQKKLRNCFQVVRALFFLLINLHRSYHLFLLNKRDNFKCKQNLISLLTSAHILCYNLDWLHFGFVTMAINRENVAKTISAQMAVSIRGYDISIYPLKNPNCYDLLWKRTNKLHYISDSLLKLAIENGFSENQTHVKITPAIDIEKFKYSEHAINKIFKITTIARLNWIKGLEYTIDALSNIKKEGFDFEYTIIGEGEEYERLKFAAYQFGILDNVKFVGKKKQCEVVEILSKTDIYIQYSIQEGFGNSVLEAQAMGCICIVSDAEGLSENVLNTETGFVVAKRNPKLLFEKILDVIHLDKKRKLEMISKSVSRLQTDFNLDIQKHEFINFYVE